MIDIFVAMLLISAIGYGMILNRRIIALRRDQVALERLAASFNKATTRAEASVSNLKKTAQDSSKILNQGIDEAVKIRDDLSFLVDRGKKLGDRLESSIRVVEPAKTRQEVGRHSNNYAKPSTVPPGLSEPAKKARTVGAETLGNEILKSEVERKFFNALRAAKQKV